MFFIPLESSQSIDIKSDSHFLLAKNYGNKKSQRRKGLGFRVEG
jgi:hypothetical protein